MFRISSSDISGPVCVLGVCFVMILMSFFCVLISGCK